MAKFRLESNKGIFTPIDRLYLLSFLLAIFFGLSIGVARAWSNPSQTPPSGEPGPIYISLGGTQADTVQQALSNLGIAASGANSDITSLSPSGNLILSPTGYVGVGTSTPSQELTVNGVIYSTTGGFMFPNGTVQTTTGS
jgi:hypothetical protein